MTVEHLLNKRIRERARVYDGAELILLLVLGLVYAFVMKRVMTDGTTSDTMRQIYDVSLWLTNRGEVFQYSYAALPWFLLIGLALACMIVGGIKFALSDFWEIKVMSRAHMALLLLSMTAVFIRASYVHLTPLL